MGADLDSKALAAAVSRFTAFATLTLDDFSALAKLAHGRRSFARGEFICHEGDRPAGLFLLLKGWTASSLTFANGARILLKVHLPGDMLGMPSLALHKSADSIEALTDVELGVVSRDELGLMFKDNGRLAALLFLISQEERVSTMDRLASIGATEAPQRLAALLLHIRGRVLRSAPESNDTFDMPLSQDQIAALIGVTPAHLSRTLHYFRERNLLSWTRHRLQICNVAEMEAISGLPLRKLDKNPDWLPENPAVN